MCRVFCVVVWPIVRTILKHKREIGLSNILAHRAVHGGGGQQFERSISTSKFPSTIAAVDAHTTGRHDSTTAAHANAPPANTVAPNFNRLGTTSVNQSMAVGAGLGTNSWKNKQPQNSVSAATSNANPLEAVAAAAVARFQFRRGSSQAVLNTQADSAVQAAVSGSPRGRKSAAGAAGSGGAGAVEMEMTASAKMRHNKKLSSAQPAIKEDEPPALAKQDSVTTERTATDLSNLLASSTPAPAPAPASASQETQKPAPPVRFSGTGGRTGSVHLPPLTGSPSPLGSLNGANASSVLRPSVTADAAAPPLAGPNPLPGATLH